MTSARYSAPSFRVFDLYLKLFTKAILYLRACILYVLRVSSESKLYMLFDVDEQRVLGPARGQPDLRGDGDPLLGYPLPLLTRPPLHRGLAQYALPAGQWFFSKTAVLM